MSRGTVILAVLVISAAYLVYGYNAMVRNKNLVSEGWSGIDVQFRRLADLISNLVATVKVYAAPKDTLFHDISEFRATSSAGVRHT